MVGEAAPSSNCLIRFGHVEASEANRLAVWLPQFLDTVVASFAPLLQGRDQGIISCTKHTVFCWPFLLLPLVLVLLTLLVLLTGFPASHHCFYIEFIVAFIAGRVGFVDL